MTVVLRVSLSSSTSGSSAATWSTSPRSGRGGVLGGSPGGTPKSDPASLQRPGEREHGLRLAVGSGLRPDVWRSFLKRFGAIRIVETYGMTEGNVTLFNYTATPGAVGRSSFIYKVGGAGERGGAVPPTPCPSSLGH